MTSRTPLPSILSIMTLTSRPSCSLRTLPTTGISLVHANYGHRISSSPLDRSIEVKDKVKARDHEKALPIDGDGRSGVLGGRRYGHAGDRLPADRVCPWHQGEAVARLLGDPKTVVHV